MSTALRHALEALAQETKALLAHPDPDIAMWEAYGGRRTAIFARLQEITFSVHEQEDMSVSALLDEIRQQEPLVLEKAQARLIRLRTEIHALATSRRALRGYTPSCPALLLERSG
jgi:hypothetical protein